jgi:hypothetical protein
VDSGNKKHSESRPSISLDKCIHTNFYTTSDKHECNGQEKSIDSVDFLFEHVLSSWQFTVVSVSSLDRIDLTHRGEIFRLKVPSLGFIMDVDLGTSAKHGTWRWRGSTRPHNHHHHTGSEKQKYFPGKMAINVAGGCVYYASLWVIYNYIYKGKCLPGRIY